MFFTTVALHDDEYYTRKYNKDRFMH